MTLLCIIIIIAIYFDNTFFIYLFFQVNLTSNINSLIIWNILKSW